MTRSVLGFPRAIVSAIGIFWALFSAFTRSTGAQGPTRTATIDVWAVTAQGTAVPDLGSQNFTVTVAGQVRPIGQFTASEVESNGGPTGSKTPTMLPPPFVTNAPPSGGRTFYLLVDSAALDEAGIRQLGVAAHAWLDRLPARDEVAIDTVEDARLLPTTDHALVQATLDLMHGRSGAPPSEAADAARSQAVLARLAALLRALRGAPTPPVVIVCTSGFSTAAVTNAIGGTGAGAPTRAGVAPPAVTFSRLRIAEALASPALYVVQLTTGTPPTAANGLRVAATQLGAGLIAAPWSTNPLGEIADETLGYYRLTVATPDLGVGVDYPVGLTVTRPGVTLRYVPAAAWLAPTENPTLDDLLASKDSIVALPLHVSARVSRATPGKLMATALVEPADRSRLAQAGAALLDPTGTVVTKVTVPPAALAPGSVSVRLPASPGRYRLRVAAMAADGRAGSVEEAIDVGLATVGPLKLGALGFGVVAPAATTPPPRGGRPVAPPPPLPRLAFSSEREGVAFFDIYGGVPNEQVRIVIEIRRRADGPPVQELQPTIQPAAVGEPDHYLVTAPIALTDLSPGDYQVQATITIANQPPAVLVQTLRKTG